MAFTLNLITVPQEADSLIKMANRDKRNLEHRKESFDLRNVNTAENAAENAGELSEANASLASVIALIATLPDGEKKEDEVTKKLDLELRIRRLTRSGSKTGAVATIEREYDADMIENQLDGIDAFITAVTARKAAL